MIINIIVIEISFCPVLVRDFLHLSLSLCLVKTFASGVGELPRFLGYMSIAMSSYHDEGVE